MKTYILISILILAIFLVACKEEVIDDTPPMPPTPPDIEGTDGTGSAGGDLDLNVAEPDDKEADIDGEVSDLEDSLENW